MPLAIVNGRVLMPNGTLEETAVRMEDGMIAGFEVGNAREIDAGGRLVLPGIVDLHGDGFERILMPRANVFFPADLALHDTANQIVSNGITTAHLAQTCSWEGGIRGVETARALFEAINRNRETLAGDIRAHLRFEIFAMDDLDEAIDWIEAGWVHLVVLNDHLPVFEMNADNEAKVTRWVAGLDHTVASFRDKLTEMRERQDEVASTLVELVKVCETAGLTVGSHDDNSADVRKLFHGLGATISEFPINMEAAEAAASLGDSVAMGAPNVLRGGSASGNVSARDVVHAGYCTYLASDYYYPAPMNAAMTLVREGLLDLSEAWDLVSRNPAQVVGLDDRGEIAEGKRGDVIVVDEAAANGGPLVMATLSAGRPAYLSAAVH